MAGGIIRLVRKFHGTGYDLPFGDVPHLHDDLRNGAATHLHSWRGESPSRASGSPVKRDIAHRISVNNR